MNTANLPTPPRSQATPEQEPHEPNTPAPNQSVAVQPPPAQTTNPAVPERESAGDYSPPMPHRRIPYFPGPTLEDEKRAMDAQNKLAISSDKNALRPCAPVIRALAMGGEFDMNMMRERHPLPESPYTSTRPKSRRRPMLEAWRTRMGLDVSTPTLSTSKGGLLSTEILDQIVVFMLLDAPYKVRPRDTLKDFAQACRRFRSVAVPYVYQHVVLEGNGDAGVYARTGNSKFVRSLTIQFEPHDPWSPFSVLMDHMLYMNKPDTKSDGQKIGLQYFFPNMTQLTFAAKFAPDDARTRWHASSQILGAEFGTGDFGPQNRSRLYENSGFLATRLVDLVPRGIKTVTLEADVPELMSNFAVTFMSRGGNPNDEVRLDLITRRDEAVQATEFAIHSHTPAPTDPVPARTTIVMYGPTYGTCIVWDGNNPAFPHQTVWRRHKQPEAPKQVLPPTWEELGPGPRRSTRKSTSPYKNPTSSEDSNSPPRTKGALTAMVKSVGRLPLCVTRHISQREPSPTPEVELDPKTPKAPEPTPEASNLPQGQKCAWSAGKELADFPNTIVSTFKQVNESFAQFASTGAERMKLEGEDAEYPEFWQFVDNLSGGQSRVGVWHTTARAEVDMFISTFREKRYEANMKAFTMQILDQFRRDGAIVERKTGGVKKGKAKQKSYLRSAMKASTSSSASASETGLGSASPDSEGRVVKRARVV